MFQSSNDIQIFETPDQDEMRERWYQRGEYFFIKNDAMKTVRKMASAKGLADDDDQKSSRGLEIVGNAAVQERAARIKRGLDVVLTRQRIPTEETAEGEVDGTGNMQKENGDTFEEMAEAYHDMAASAELLARNRAWLDRKEAVEYLQDTGQQLKKHEERKRVSKRKFGRLLGWFKR
jgi:hypothetical protein